MQGSKVCAVALLALVACAAAPAGAAVRNCLAPITTTVDDAKSETEGKQRVLAAWITEATKLGDAFTAWRLAIRRNLSCEQTAAGAFACQAVGMPCRYDQVRTPGWVPLKPGGI